MKKTSIIRQIVLAGCVVTGMNLLSSCESCGRGPEGNGEAQEINGEIYNKGTEADQTDASGSYNGTPLDTVNTGSGGNGAGSGSGSSGTGTSGSGSGTGGSGSSSTNSGTNTEKVRDGGGSMGSGMGSGTGTSGNNSRVTSKRDQ